MTTSPARMRALPRAPITLPDSDLSAEARSTLLLSSTGTSANNTVEMRHTPALSTSTRQSICPGRKIGPLRGGIKTLRRLRHQYARRTPPPAPIMDSNNPSVKSCCSTRPRPAPRARRAVISWRRAKNLTSSRLLTFAQTIRSTSIPIPSAMPNVGSIKDAPLKGAFHNGSTLIPCPRLVAG